MPNYFMKRGRSKMKQNFLLKSHLLMSERLELGMRYKHFHGLTIAEIRDKLEEMGIRRHIVIEAKTTEIAIITPKGILMQIRSDEGNSLSLWGGEILDDEDPADAAVRRLYEESGIKVEREQMEFRNIYGHRYKYENGDTCDFHTYQYAVILDYVPEVTLNDKTSIGSLLINHTIVGHQQPFIQNLLTEMKE